MMRSLFIFSIFVASIIGIGILWELYMRFRKRINKPQIGVEILINLLNKDDYVCIDGKVLRFSHIARKREVLNIAAPPSELNSTIGGELAFLDDRYLGYRYYHTSAMKECEFIYGKYGLKWASSSAIATNAKERIDNEY